MTAGVHLGESAEGGVVVASAEFVEPGGRFEVFSDVADGVAGDGRVGRRRAGFAGGRVAVSPGVCAVTVEDANGGTEVVGGQVTSDGSDAGGDDGTGVVAVDTPAVASAAKERTVTSGSVRSAYLSLM